MDDRGVHLVWNGILVTRDSPGRTMAVGLRYRGPAYGESWPLNPHSVQSLGIVLTAEENEVVRKVWEETTARQNPPDCLASESPDVLGDTCLAWEYISSCLSHGMKVRALLCATPSPFPVLPYQVVDSLLPDCQHLGYDYWDGGELSALWDTALTELMEFGERLNPFGLFDAVQLVDQYAVAHKRLELAGRVESSAWMITDVWQIRLSDSMPLRGGGTRDCGL